ncbi:MAG: type IV secretory system conjugative DNA transfer family protein [Acidimicrobiales bacterium]|nr:type IV secretory system conjugative DNA transfer family protein [Acidimicrobiales bacterium]
MSAVAVVTTAIGVSAFVGAGLLGPHRPHPGRLLPGGLRFGARRPHLPPPGRRAPSRVGVPRRGRPIGVGLRPSGPGQRGAAHWAGPRDLRLLLTAPGHDSVAPPGRLVLGWVGKRLVAAERAQSVIVFGPTQSQKTSGFAVPAILGWEGPVIATSIKTDLIDHTFDHRRSRGLVQCFDPSGSTGLASVSWSPLPGARTWPGARRAAAALTEVAKASVGTMSDGDFWYATATKMLGPLLFAAAFGGRDMGDVVRWVDTGEESEVLEILASAGVAEATHAALSTFGKEDRQRSSIYTTVETVLEPFTGTTGDPDRGGGRLADPAHLVEGSNTLYLCAPAHDQRRLTPLFVSVVRQAIEHVYDRAARTHRPLDPPLLIVLDEAANIAPLADLDALASTAAGHGVQLVTVWHDLAQITARYGSRATTVVNNHRAKLFLSGISDPSTLDYASHLIGEEEVLLPATTHGGPSGPSTTRSPSVRRLAPPDALRRIAPGEGVLVYGDRPPARLRLRPWFSDPGLRQRVFP